MRVLHSSSGSREWRIGTRNSPLAQFQAKEARTILAARHGLDPASLQLVPKQTTGDILRDEALADFGGKGLFVGELHSALAIGEIDLAVHSAKDVPTEFENSIHIAAALPRGDCAEALVCQPADSIETLPPDAKIGTASPRRQAQFLARRSDLVIELLRGNVETRIAAVRNPGGPVATLLASAGLARLGITGDDIHRLDPDQFLPALAQGIIVITTRSDDAEATQFAQGANDPDAWDALLAERAFLAGLGGDCHSPIAGVTKVSTSELYLEGEILRRDGLESFRLGLAAPREHAERTGHQLAATLLAQAGETTWKG